MRLLSVLSIFYLAIILQGCKTSKPSVSTNQQAPIKASEIMELPIYRASNTISHDLVNTSLKVSFDWKKRTMAGIAQITLHPHFKASNLIVLNARGMKINEVSMVRPDKNILLSYEYRNDSLLITLDRDYQKEENYTLYIDYVARPEELDSVGGSAAITSDKGLYFINADGKEKYKPRQIWTQGETQANSVWFPTIDATNQKMTQDIAITVDSSLVTLSNGLLVKSTINADGTRTDYWKQTLPHAPYLAMMTIGNFAIVKDSWRGKEVSYYVEPEFKSVARNIFGKTPAMLEFFSTKLGVPFVWEKYAQVVARDYVSGSMENSSATLHGEFLQQTPREMLDESYEEFISHELFHQWFGDLVTCESWSNLPLNESFATYGEYLWNEYEFGKEAADFGYQSEMSVYLREAKYKQFNLIRFNYVAREDMFDRHSYEKGGCVLHMLRNYVGDDAFFASLKFYLEKNKFKPVEIHQLRLAFEEVTGEDLNWFFNQWFLSSGHPELEIAYAWDEKSKEETVTISQLQNFSKTPLFKLPLDVDVYVNDKATTKPIVCTKSKQSFVFNCNSKPDFVNVDARKMLLCTKKDSHTTDEWIYLYKHGKLYTDRREALMALGANYEAESPAAAILFSALDDPFWSLRRYAVNNLSKVATSTVKEQLKSKLYTLIISDPVAGVRQAAIKAVLKYFPEGDHSIVLKKAVNDSSYSVSGEALSAFTEKNKEEGLLIAKKIEDLSVRTSREQLFSLYSKYGSDDQFDFMNDAYSRTSGYDRYYSLELYSNYLKRCNTKPALNQGLTTIADQAKSDELWLSRMAAYKELLVLKKYFTDKENSYADFNSLKLKADEYINDIKSSEKDSRVKKSFDSN